VNGRLVSNCFATIYGAIPETKYAVMKKERKRDTGLRAFPDLRLEDSIKYTDRWHKHHPWTQPWQQNELRLYRARGYAMSAILDQRKRYGPLEDNMIPNHAILAFEGSLKNKAIQEIDAAIPHRGWSAWSGLVFDGHDFLMVQVPDPRAEEAARIVEAAMAYEYNGMRFKGKAKITDIWGDQ